MGKSPLPLVGPQKLEPDIFQARGIKRTLKILLYSLTTLENSIESFSQLDPSEASTGFSVAHGELGRFRDSVVLTRLYLVHFFKAIGRESELKNPPEIVFNLDRNPNSPLTVARRLTSGITGCRNALQELLTYKEPLLKKQIAEMENEKKYLKRLAALMSALKYLLFSTPEEARAAVKTLKKKTASHPKHFPTPNAVILKENMISKERARKLEDLFEQKRDFFHSETSYALAKEIAIQIADYGDGLPFEELRKLFPEFTDRTLRVELEILKDTLQNFDLRLIGAFTPLGRPPIAFGGIED